MQADWPAHNLPQREAAVPGSSPPIEVAQAAQLVQRRVTTPRQRIAAQGGPGRPIVGVGQALRRVAMPQRTAAQDVPELGPGVTQLAYDAWRRAGRRTAA